MKETEFNEKIIACVCLKCYALRCSLRSAENKCCPENGPVDWKGRKING